MKKLFLLLFAISTIIIFIGIADSASAEVIACDAGNRCANGRMCSVAGAPVSENNPNGGAGSCLTTHCNQSTNCASYFGPGSTCQSGNCTRPNATSCTGPNNTDSEARGGLVPCGISKYADPIPAGSPPGAVSGAIKCPCTLTHLFEMLRRVYIFITWTLAIPLAGLLIAVGGVVMLVSGANPNWFDFGKRMLWGAFWGLALVFGAWVIMSVIFLALGINLNPGLIQFN